MTKTYIKREEILATFKAIVKNTSYPWFHINEIVDEILKAPAADVVERKYGEWIDISCVVRDYDGDWVATQYQCSLCGRKGYKKEPFCNCGADMRKKG